MAANVAERRDRAERLRGLADDARAQAEAQEAALQDLGEPVGIAPQLRLEQLDSRLGGRTCRRSPFKSFPTVIPMR